MHDWRGSQVFFQSAMSPSHDSSIIVNLLQNVAQISMFLTLTALS